MTCRVVAGNGGRSFAHDARIEGRAGEAGFEIGHAVFVILHRIEGVAGAPAGRENTDGRTVKRASSS